MEKMDRFNGRVHVIGRSHVREELMQRTVSSKRPVHVNKKPVYSKHGFMQKTGAHAGRSI